MLLFLSLALAPETYTCQLERPAPLGTIRAGQVIQHFGTRSYRNTQWHAALAPGLTLAVGWFQHDPGLAPLGTGDVTFDYLPPEAQRGKRFRIEIASAADPEIRFTDRWRKITRRYGRHINITARLNVDQLRRHLSGGAAITVTARRSDGAVMTHARLNAADVARALAVAEEVQTPLTAMTADYANRCTRIVPAPPPFKG